MIVARTQAVIMGNVEKQMESRDRDRMGTFGLDMFGE